MDFWRLSADLTLVQAALLIIGEDPSVAEETVLKSPLDARPAGFEATLTALKRAVETNELRAEPGVRYSLDTFEPEPYPPLSKVAVVDLQNWLAKRRMRPAFFFPELDSAPVPTDLSPSYLNPSSQYYSSKLAAAVRAWEAVSADPNMITGTTVKQAMMSWLRANAREFGLVKPDGTANELGIEEVAKIANWDTKGGAPKTPGNS